MTLIFDERAKRPGQPGLHALIAGVSEYPNLPKADAQATPQSFGMRQLSSTALTAYKVFRWLVDHKQNFPVPLATCRLLLSPTPDEIEKIKIDAEPDLTEQFEKRRKGDPNSCACTLDNFIADSVAWRNDASSQQRNITLFYFAGHGVERNKGDAVLLLEGFGSPGGILRNAVDMNNIFNGMASADTRPNMAETQLYFVDACRDFLPAFKKIERPPATGVFDPELTGADRRRAPIFYAAAPGTQARAIPHDQTLFSKALLECLNGEAGELKDVEFKDKGFQEKWHISVHSLNRALAIKVNDWNKALGAEQDFILSGLVADTPICFLNNPPLVEVILEVDPLEALKFTKFQVLNDQGAPIVEEVPMPLNPHPYRSKWPAGFYTISVTIDPANPLFMNLVGSARPIMPPRVNRKVKVSP